VKHNPIPVLRGLAEAVRELADAVHHHPETVTFAVRTAVAFQLQGLAARVAPLKLEANGIAPDSKTRVARIVLVAATEPAGSFLGMEFGRRCYMMLRDAQDLAAVAALPEAADPFADWKV
jgi:hypothetical protein